MQPFPLVEPAGSFLLQDILQILHPRLKIIPQVKSGDLFHQFRLYHECPPGKCALRPACDFFDSIRPIGRPLGSFIEHSYQHHSLCLNLFY